MLPENWDSLLIFLACNTQWNVQYAGMSGVAIYQGLNYQGVATLIKMRGYRGKRARELFADVQYCEAIAKPLLNERS